VKAWLRRVVVLVLAFLVAPLYGQSRPATAAGVPPWLISVIRSAVSQELRGASRVEVEIVRISGRVPDGVGPASVVVRPIGRVRPNSVSTFRLSARGGALGSWAATVAARVRVYRPVVVAARDIRAGKLLSAEDLTLEERCVPGMLGEPVLSLGEAVGKVCRGSVRAGAVLTRRLLREPEAVKRGERVRLVVAFGHVWVETQGRALQSGAIGDEILVRNDRSGKTVRGVVVASGEVRVRP